MDWNVDYARRVSKADFVKNHPHVKNAGEEWEKLQPKKEVVKDDKK